jgi:hypothetical protein
MIQKFFRKIFRLIQYPMTPVRLYREFWDRRSRQKRIDSARRLLEQNNVLSLLTSGNESEIPPQLPDLANLYNLIRERRPRIVLEFGIGFSTLVIASALRDNLQDHNLRGHLFSVDAQKDWIENTQAKIPKELVEFVTIHHSTLSTMTLEGTLCHMYDSLPDISPNFIYVDGPEGLEVKGGMYGLGFSNGRSVISADPLLYESTAPLDFFILVDGRWETCRFLERHLKGKYRHQAFTSRKIATFEYVSRRYY